jgi:myo-inositol-1-phosphate synthase
MPERVVDIAPAQGKLGVLLVGLGAVSTTFVAGVEAIKRGLAKPVGSLTQMGTIRLGKRTDNNVPRIKDFVPLAELDDIVFGAWDIFPDNAFDAAMNAGVLDKDLLNQVSEQLASLKPMAAVFEQNYVKRLHGDNVKTGKNKMDLAEQLIDEIARFKADNGCDRLVMVWAASTEIFLEESDVHRSLEAFERAMYDNDPAIAPSMIYAYAALKSGVPFANGAPNLSVDIPALVKLADEMRVPICGKDFKTGQTWMKTRRISRRKKSRSCLCSSTYCSPKYIRISTKAFRTWCASTTILLAATTKRDGTISIYSDGSVTRCRSRSTSFAATRFSPHRFVLTSHCS